MLFSIFRSHRNRFYWRNGKLHFVKQNRQQQQRHQTIFTPEQEQLSFKENIRQWLIFYSVLVSIILAIVIYRLNFHQKTSK
jgi:hypothetical protein